MANDSRAIQPRSSRFLIINLDECGKKGVPFHRRAKLALESPIFFSLKGLNLSLPFND